jgi:hypothetical protein
MRVIYIKYFAFFLASLFVLSGCSDDEVVPTPGGSTQSGMTAVVNGADWASSGGSFRLGTRVISRGASAFVGAGDTLTIIGVQVQGTDTTAIVLSVKLNVDKVGSYKLRSGASGDGKAYFLTGLSVGAFQDIKGKYDGGTTNGELRISRFDAANYSVSGSFGFSMAASGETTYTVVAGELENIPF